MLFSWNDPSRPSPSIFLPLYNFFIRAPACPVWSSPPTASTILPYTPAIPWRSNIHVQGCPWSSGIPHAVHFHTFCPQRATRPRLQVSTTEMIYVPSPIGLHHSGCTILEQPASSTSQRILGEILQDTPGCPLAVPVPRGTHLTNLRPQSIPSAHIDPRKTITAKWPFPHKPITHMAVFSSLCCFANQ